MYKKRILVAALNWGLGHAARCIPIIKQLEKFGFEPYIASDGPALFMLQQEFPYLKSFILPSYNIQYSKKASNFKLKMLLNTPTILRAIKTEKKITKEIVEKYNIQGIISDSRFGVRHPSIKNVFISHQLNVLSGTTTYFSSKLHLTYIKKYDQCWVPDSSASDNLSGFLGHPNFKISNIKYIGPLSRFTKEKLPIKYHYLALLSGPEPQRSILEDILLNAFEKTEQKILLVRGVVDQTTLKSKNPQVTIKNHLFGSDLENALNSSDVVIGRSGYTSIMDFSKLEKKAFLIPTPGQPEQEYLANRLAKLGVASTCRQNEFSLEKLDSVKSGNGFKDLSFNVSFGDLFRLFQGE